jgi:cold shock protein
MGKGRDFRGPRRRGFDDDPPSPYDTRGIRPPPSSFGGSRPSEPVAATGPIVDATVKWFNPEKGFGFTELADGSGDAFLHIGTLQASGHDTVAPGSKLRVQVGQGAKGPQITKVLEVDASTATEQAPRSGPRMGAGAGAGGARTPRFRPDPSTAVEMVGTVKWYNGDKGFGFVSSEDGGKDIFVHVSVLGAAGLVHLAEGQLVTMRVVETPKGREAISIALTS